MSLVRASISWDGTTYFAGLPGSSGFCVLVDLYFCFRFRFLVDLGNSVLLEANLFDAEMSQYNTTRS